MPVRRLEEIDRLLASGRAEPAWQLVEQLLEKLPAGVGLAEWLQECVSLAVHYRATDRAAEWLELCRSREPRGDATFGELIRLLEIPVLLATRDYDSAARTEAAVDWRLVDSVPWAVNVRLLFFLHSAPLERFLEVKNSSTADFIDPHDVGDQYRMLLHYELDSGDVERCLELAGRALSHFGEVGGLRGRLKEVDVRACIGRAYMGSGSLRKAAAEFRCVLQLARTYHLEFYYERSAQDLAWIRTYLGDTAGATELLSSVPDRPAETPGDLIERARLLQHRAEIALACEDLEAAEQHVAEGEALLDRCTSLSQKGYLCITRAKLATLRGTPDSRREAVEALDLAEECLRKKERRGRHGLLEVTIARGFLHLTMGQRENALDCLRRGMTLAGELNCLPIQARCLLLKSCIMVDRALPVDEQLYEEILRELGLVDSPTLLLKVLANLYMYTWDLRDDGGDLTQQHLHQIQKLRGILEEDVFQRLYHRYVTTPVFTRTLARVFGIDPQSFSLELD